jgi:hypothetical protein
VARVSLALAAGIALGSVGATLLIAYKFRERR